MKTWNFYFYDLQTQRTTPLKNEIDEWKSFGINYGREAKTSIVKSYSSGFTFIKEDAFFLKNIVYTRGFNVRIRLDVYKVTSFGEKFEYSGFLDLSQCEIKGKTFNCPIDEGGFYNLLNNTWTDEFEFNDGFKNMLFHGGYYQYVEKLGICKNENESTNIPITLGNSFTNFLPLKKISEGNKKLKFFNEAKEKSIQGNGTGVTDSQCFIVSENKVNGGRLVCDFKEDLGTIILNDYAPMSNIDVANLATINGYLLFYIYNDVGVEEWKVRENLLSGVELSKKTTFFSEKVKVNRSERKVFIKDIYNTQDISEQDITGYLSQYQMKGYKVAVALRITDIQFHKMNKVSGAYDYIDKMNVNEADFIPSENFIIWYRNDAFSINQWSSVHGIYPSDLFIKFIDKINTGYRLGINLNLLKEMEKCLICSGTTLLGSINDCRENNVNSSITTTLEQLIDFIYKVYGLKFICRFKDGIYQLKFVKIEDCYQNIKIEEFTNFAELSINSYTEVMYTSIKVGYKNNNDVIFGLHEFNTTNNFKTGNIELVSKELDLQSPYTAGALDVETFIYENNGIFDDTKDGSNQIYVIEVPKREAEQPTVEVTFSSGMFTLQEPRIKRSLKLRNVISVINNEKIKSTINTYFTPKRILQRHERELSSFLFKQKKLTFISSEKNADFTFEGINEKEDVVLTDNEIFIPFVLDVKIPAVYSLIEKIEKEPLGYFLINMGGSKYKGYIANGTDAVSVNPMNEQASTLKLILHPESYF